MSAEPSVVEMQPEPQLDSQSSGSSVQGSASTEPSIADSASDCDLSSPDPKPDHSNSESNLEEPKVVRVPDLFASIMAVKPYVNQHYHLVKPKCNAWVTKVLKGDDRMAIKFDKLDIAFLVAMWSPYCDEEALAVMTDWNNWVFLFDDMFDEGDLSSDPVAAAEEIARTTEVIAGTGRRYTAEETEHPLIVRYIMQDICDRYRKRAGPDLLRRWLAHHERYFRGLASQVRDVHDGRALTRNVEDYLEMRRGSIGVYPAIALTEYASGVELPQEIVDHPAMEELMLVSTELVFLVNDVLSYKKDLALGVEHNLITLLKAQGKTTQEALDEIDVMMQSIFKRWYKALADVPIYGEKLDREVLKFVDACRDVALGNLYWSFKTGRYLGCAGQEVHDTRMLKLD